MTTQAPPAGPPLAEAVQGWIDEAQAKLAHAPLTAADLAGLKELVGAPTKLRQRLLYLHTSSPSPRSLVVAMDRLDPCPGGADVELTPEPVFPYASVWDAICDGWQVVQFPEYALPIPDREIDVPGYQFILQKLEVYRD